MDVFILRHGRAEDSGPGMSDAGRRLTGRGKREIADAARYLALLGIRFGLIAASPLARASETAAIVARTLGQEDRVVSWDVLIPGGEPVAVCRAISACGDMEAILLVGHEPLLSSLIGWIISGGEGAAIGLSKGGCAKIREFTCAEKPSGELHWLLTARQMADLR